MRKFILAIVVGVTVAAVPAHAVNIIDGGFEIQGAASVGTSGFCYLGGTCASGAWSGSGGFIGENNGDWPGIPTSGSYFGFVQGGGSLVQTFSVATAGLYTLNWFDAGRTRGGYDGPHGYTVLLGATVIGGNTTASSTSFTAQSSSSFLLAANTNYALTFQGIANGDTTSFIDDVSLSGSVPEPASWAMMLGGFGLVGAAMRRRRTLASA